MIDEAFFESLYQQYQPMVVQLCMGYVKGNTEKAMDLAQEVFINAWNGLPKFQGKASYKTWIYRITVNTCLMQIRREKTWQQVKFQELKTDLPDSSEVDNHKELYEAIGKLENVDRLTIMLVLEELDYPEIAKILGISEGTLRVKIHRIKKRLKKILEHE